MGLGLTVTRVAELGTTDHFLEVYRPVKRSILDALTLPYPGVYELTEHYKRSGGVLRDPADRPKTWKALCAPGPQLPFNKPKDCSWGPHHPEAPPADYEPHELELLNLDKRCGPLRECFVTVAMTIGLAVVWGHNFNRADGYDCSRAARRHQAVHLRKDTSAHNSLRE